MLTDDQKLEGLAAARNETYVLAYIQGVSDLGFVNDGGFAYMENYAQKQYEIFKDTGKTSDLEVLAVGESTATTENDQVAFLVDWHDDNIPSQYGADVHSATVILEQSGSYFGPDLVWRINTMVEASTSS